MKLREFISAVAVLGLLVGCGGNSVSGPDGGSGGGGNPSPSPVGKSTVAIDFLTRVRDASRLQDGDEVTCEEGYHELVVAYGPWTLDRVYSEVWQSGYLSVDGRTAVGYTIGGASLFPPGYYTASGYMGHPFAGPPGVRDTFYVVVNLEAGPSYDQRQVIAQAVKRFHLRWKDC